MPKVSFIIPTKNSGKTIEECLSSLMPYYEQGHIEEIILVDGLSTDDTVDKARRFPVNIRREPTAAASMTVAVHIGWQNAAGDLVVFFDSDAYLGDGFLPQLFDFFQDQEVGVLGCDVRPVIGNDSISIAMAQWATNDREAHFSPKGLGRLHHWISAKDNPLPTPHGPCLVARRGCIEAVDGFRGLPSRFHFHPDEALSKRIMWRGWKARWWLNAPVYHHTRATVKSLLRQYAHNGAAMGLLHQEKEFRESAFRKAVCIAGRLGTPLEGLVMAVRWRNPTNLILYPLVHYAFLLGYLGGLITRPKVEERIP